MKSCFKCKGRKVRYIRDDNMRITLQCEKCGYELKTPYLTEDSARSCWCTHMSALELGAKMAAAENSASES